MQEPTRRGNKSTHNDEIVIFEQLHNIHLEFLKFALTKGHHTPPPQFIDVNAHQDELVAVVWYKDGKREVLKSGSMAMLIKHREWRIQVLALQSYIKPSSTSQGLYSLSTIPRAMSDDAAGNAGALDILTKSLAEYAEKAYVAGKTENDDNSDDDLQQSIRTPPVLPKSNIKVTNMSAEFITDETGKLWFSHLSRVHVRVIHTTLEKKIERERVEETKVIEAANVVGSELKRLLRMASNRGVSVSSSFAHFDPQGVGYADLSCLIDGLSRLGIGISEKAGEILMSMIGQASSLHFRSSDLVMFAELDDEEEEERGSSSLEMGGSYMDGNESYQSGSTRNSSRRSYSTTSNNNKKRPTKNAFVKVDNQSDELIDPNELVDAAQLDLDYKVGGAPTVKQQEKEPLPRWARKSTKKAYMELQRAGERAGKRRKKSFAYDDDVSDSDYDGDEGNADRATTPTTANIHRSYTQESARDITFPDEEKTNLDAPNVSLDATDTHEETKQMIKDEEGAEKDEEESVSLQSTNESSSINSLVPSLALSNDDDDNDIDNNDSDNLFHSHNSIVMTYRILTAANRPIANRREGSTILQNTVSYQNAQNILERIDPPKDTPFTLIVTPDIFMTLDTLEETFTQLLEQSPKSRILLVGLPGLPNTLWQKSTVLNNETHSDCLSHLLQHLETSKTFPIDENIPVFMLGFGNGTSCLTYFASAQLHDDPHWILKRNLRCMLLCNSFCRIDQELKRTIQGVRRVFKKDDFHERVQLLLTLMFSDEYLEEIGRDKAMEVFWSSRRKISLDGEFPSKQRKHSSNICSGNGKEGITALLHGMQSHIDITPHFDMLSVPLLLIQSSRDNFIAPTNIGVFENTDEEYEVVDSPRDLVYNLREQMRAGGKNSESSG